MPAESDHPDEELWDEDDPEGPQELDLDRDDAEDDTVPCPACGHQISDLAEQCPHCQTWIVPGADPRTGPSWWLVGMVLLAGMAFLIWSVL